MQLTHRNVWINATVFGLHASVCDRDAYLWTLPMFHCSGWTYTWAVTAAAGTHVCLRKVDPARIFADIVEHRVTHMCAAPPVITRVRNGGVFFTASGA